MTSDVWQSPVLIALLNTVGAVILAFFTYKTQKEVKKNSTKLDTAAVKVEVASEKLEEVHKQTNGNISRLQDAHDALAEENKRLTNVIIQQKQDAEARVK